MTEFADEAQDLPASPTHVYLRTCKQQQAQRNQVSVLLQLLLWLTHDPGSPQTRCQLRCVRSTYMVLRATGGHHRCQSSTPASDAASVMMPAIRDRWMTHASHRTHLKSPAAKREPVAFAGGVVHEAVFPPGPGRLTCLQLPPPHWALTGASSATAASTLANKHNLQQQPVGTKVSATSPTTLADAERVSNVVGLHNQQGCVNRVLFTSYM